MLTQTDFENIIQEAVNQVDIGRLDDCDYRSFDYAQVRAHTHLALKSLKEKGKLIQFVFKAVKFGMTLSKVAAIATASGNEVKGVKWEKYGISNDERTLLRGLMVQLKQGGFSILDLPKAYPELALKIYLSGNYEPIVQTDLVFAFPGGYFFCDSPAEKALYADYNREVTRVLTQKADPEVRAKALNPHTWATVSAVMDRQKTQHPSLKTEDARAEFMKKTCDSGKIVLKSGHIYSIGNTMVSPDVSIKDQLSAAVWR